MPPSHKETAGARVAHCTSDGTDVLRDKQITFKVTFQWGRPTEMWRSLVLSFMKHAPFLKEASMALRLGSPSHHSGAS